MRISRVSCEVRLKNKLNKERIIQPWLSVIKFTNFSQYKPFYMDLEMYSRKFISLCVA